VGGLPEIVEDGTTGLLTTNDPSSIAERITRLLNDPVLARRLSIAARIRVENDFTLDHMVNGTVQVYERMLS
jgi:glycosyltransferase involved in cell wall biosynthesis